jgi:hypothetical protein
MVNGGDPQLDKAIAQMLQEVAERPYKPVAPPPPPDRKGMGITTPDR